MRIVVMLLLAFCSMTAVAVTDASGAAQNDGYYWEEEGGGDNEDGYAEEGEAEVDGRWWASVDEECQTARFHRKFRTWFGRVVWRYYQQVMYCWNGNNLTWVHRDRWPETHCCFWRWGGHVGNSCYSEHCTEMAGRDSAYIVTVGQFQHCFKWGCVQERYPRVGMVIYNNGHVAFVENSG